MKKWNFLFLTIIGRVRSPNGGGELQLFPFSIAKPYLVHFWIWLAVQKCSKTYVFSFRQCFAQVVTLPPSRNRVYSRLISWRLILWNCLFLRDWLIFAAFLQKSVRLFYSSLLSDMGMISFTSHHEYASILFPSLHNKPQFIISVVRATKCTSNVAWTLRHHQRIYCPLRVRCWRSGISRHPDGLHSHDLDYPCIAPGSTGDSRVNGMVSGSVCWEKETSSRSNLQVQ